LWFSLSGGDAHVESQLARIGWLRAAWLVWQERRANLGLK
jgi:hypothetical protein